VSYIYNLEPTWCLTFAVARLDPWRTWVGSFWYALVNVGPFNYSQRTFFGHKLRAPITVLSLALIGQICKPWGKVKASAIMLIKHLIDAHHHRLIILSSPPLISCNKCGTRLIVSYHTRKKRLLLNQVMLNQVIIFFSLIPWCWSFFNKFLNAGLFLVSWDTMVLELESHYLDLLYF